MYLSRINISGFKSFTEPVLIHFDPKISVIIGSNGVGKSNVLDAIAWALGEEDQAKLRCTNRSDLFFAGSGITSKSEHAVVELTFTDNANDFVISRSMHGTGEDAFLFKNKQFKTVTDFRSAIKAAGLGFVRRNIIRQEKLTDFFFKTAEQKKKFLGRYIKTDDDLKAVNGVFQQYLAELIPGASGNILLDNGAGGDVEIQFPKKGAKRGILLSGGERATTALALNLALFDMADCPLYMLDEVEPSLDWTHNHNVQGLLKKVSEKHQLIMVTHFQSTIRLANTVHGVRIRPDGSSWLKFHFVMDERLFKIYKCC